MGQLVTGRGSHRSLLVACGPLIGV